MSKTYVERIRFSCDGWYEKNDKILKCPNITEAYGTEEDINKHITGLGWHIISDAVGLGQDRHLCNKIHCKPPGT